MVGGRDGRPHAELFCVASFVRFWRDSSKLRQPILCTCEMRRPPLLFHISEDRIHLFIIRIWFPIGPVGSYPVQLLGLMFGSRYLELCKVGYLGCLNESCFDLHVYVIQGLVRTWFPACQTSHKVVLLLPLL